MATERRNAGRRIMSQAEAQAITAKAGTGKTAGAPGGGAGAAAAAQRGPGINRREFMAYAMAGATAALTAASLAVLTIPDPASDPLLGPVFNAVGLGQPDSTGTPRYPIVGGFAYPRIKAGTFGGRFVLERKVDSYTADEVPELNAQGKFYIVKVPTLVPGEGGAAGQQGVMAIYQVCTHLGCLIPYIETEKRFICPCHGSTFERDTVWVRGPAPRNLDQFPITVGPDGTITVDTGRRISGVTHA
jgi:cytochrome b6-f complex iron-sulfur subunit